ncbi:CPBP family intramembrane glutamic endopeptidase [Crocinitomix catalasitica]|uniref:CPBP family intramembrane glutamic endopeptidase n=1 Tax=Crocinitomix catalasitica TaxID=184607 RepID=UPI000488F46E|nr:type II CAAX endopeptidase family protein [Crocinitomix catalasitica]
MKNTNKFIAQANHGDNRWWKYLLAIISILAAFSFGQIPLTLFSYYKKKDLGISDEKFLEYMENTNFSALGISENTFFLLLLTMFIFAFFVIIWLLPIIHKRTTLSFITTRNKFDFNRFLFGLVIWFVVAFMLIFLLLDSDKYIYNFEVDKFIPLAIIAIILVPIQTAVEEIFYRGFLMQGIYRLTNKKWITLLIITILFAISHAFNPEFKNGFLTIIPAYLIFSFVMGYIAIVDNGLEIPIGIHTGNNLFVAIILSASGASVTTPSLFKTDIHNLVDILPALLVLLSVFSFALLKLKYKWKLKI